MAKGGKDYFGLDYIVSLILVIIPVTNWICGFITRWQEKHYICALVRLLVGWNIIWIADIISMILTHKIFRLFK